MWIDAGASLEERYSVRKRRVGGDEVLRIISWDIERAVNGVNDAG